MESLLQAEQKGQTAPILTFPFDVFAKGRQGDFELVKAVPNQEECDLPLDLGFFALDEQVQVELQEKYLTPSRQFSKRLLEHDQRYWERDIDLESLIHIEPTKNKIQLTMERDLITGKVDFWNYSESLNTDTSSTAKNSTSMNRDPSSYTNFVRGNASNYPFAPGGLESVTVTQSTTKNEGIDSEIDELIKDGLLSIPPGFERGLEENAVEKNQIEGKLNLNDIFSDIDDDILKLLGGEDKEDNVVEEDVLQEKIAPDVSVEEKVSEIDSLLPKQNVVLKKLAPKVPQKEWAIMVDIDHGFPDFHKVVPDMAYKYPFELDVFQKQAVFYLEQGESVFVAAHTSAGKTVVAEYAIALAHKHMTRTIYTSPIKALSNQKFRDFRTTFEDVGILTGDIQINPEASCLIMTTEILRSMLYRGADLIRDVEFVIFDEVHYVNDADRGVVWEEVIIMLPAHVNLILLSATVPNTKEFADWVGRTKKKNIYVISTSKRPVPLEHYLYADKDIYKIVDSDKKFLPLGYKKACDAINPPKEVPKASDKNQKSRGASNARGGRGASNNRGGGGRGGSFRSVEKTDKNLYVHMIGLLRKKNLLPVIVFTFSKKKCEEYANALINIDLTSGGSEKSEIHVFCERSLNRLKGTDRELPQVLRMRELLSRGIGVHHGGLLPIIKEMVEILFTRGLVKILFATETFAMGVNAPAKAVVYSGIRKHDGTQFRYLLPGEYTQMSGRAGRRGLDDRGVVIIACGDEIVDQPTLTRMMLGVPTKLQSQFRLTYNMILNLLRVEALKVEEMIKRSFSENVSQKMLPEQEKEFAEKSKVLDSIDRLKCTICSNDIHSYYDISSRIVLLNHDLREKLMATAIGSKSLSAGRVVIVNNTFYRNSIAVIFRGNTMATSSLSKNDEKNYFNVFILVDRKDAGVLPTSKDLAPLPVTCVDIPGSGRISHDALSIPYTDIAVITKYQIKINSDISMEDSDEVSVLEQQLYHYALEMVEKGDLCEQDWSKIKELEFQEKYNEKLKLIKSLVNFKCTQCPDLAEHYGKVHEEKSIQQQLSDLAHVISDQNLELLPDYFQRVQVLKNLSFIDENEVVQLKGRVACEINTADELILTELVLDNVLADFTPPEIVALLSCFVFQEKSQSESLLTPNLERGVEIIKKIATRVAQVQQAEGLDVRVEDALSKLKFGLVEVVYEWAKGMPFKSITDLTDVSEGSIVRCIVRLEETCREVRGASRIIGDPKMFKKMEEASECIKRDIVFAGSLYF